MVSQIGQVSVTIYEFWTEVQAQQTEYVGCTS